MHTQPSKRKQRRRATPRPPSRAARASRRIAIAGALCAALVFAISLRVRSDRKHEGQYSDGGRHYASLDEDPIRHAVWSVPETLSQAINTPGHEGRAAFSPDGRLLVFAAGEPGIDADLYVADWIGGEASNVRALELLNTAADEIAPAFSAQALYFASNAPGGRGGLDLYRAAYSDGSFGVVEALPSELNSAADDCDPACIPGTEALVFASNRDGGSFDLYCAEPDPLRARFVVRALSALDSPGNEREPALSADARFLYFASDRAGSSGGFDLYRSGGVGGPWRDPRPLLGLASAADERAPCLSTDGFTLLFTRTTRHGGADLLRAHSIELQLVPRSALGWRERTVFAALLAVALIAWLSKRWPQIAVIYKCLLASLVLHALVLWWCDHVYSEAQGTPAEEEEFTPIHIRFTPRASDAADGAGGLAGGSATTREQRLAQALAAGPGKVAVPLETMFGERDDQLLAAAGNSVLAPQPQALATRGREQVELEPAASGATSSVEIEQPATAFERIAAATPELGLPGAAGSESSARAARATAPAGPARAPAASSDQLAQPSAVIGVGGGVEFAPQSSGARTAARSSGATAGMKRESSARAELAQPTEARASYGGAAPGTGLEPTLVASSVVEAGAGLSERPLRSFSFEAGAPAPSGGSAMQDEAAFTTGSLPTTSVRASASGVDRAPSPSSHAPTFADAEPPRGASNGSAQAGVGGAMGGTGSGDLLASLDSSGAKSGTPETLGGGGGIESRAPARWSASDAGAPALPAERARASESGRGSSDGAGPARKPWDATPYQNRSAEGKARALELYGGNVRTERAVEAGLAYLARIQGKRGQWGRASERDEKYGQIAVGKTGLCLLAFLGAGHTHVSRTPHAPVVTKALAFLLSVQDEKSGHFGDSSAYDHGIATYALAECLALSGDDALREPLAHAVAHILERQSQLPDRRFHGGWGYYYGDDRVFDRWPRTSITVWQVMALESARLSGIAVPDAAFSDARAFLEHAQDTEHGYFRYNHDPERLQSGYPTLPASTPAALFALSLSGVDVGAPQCAQWRSFILQRAPASYSYGSDEDFVVKAQGNLYFWYYATLAMFRVGGKAWESWNEALQRTLLPAQATDGSWPPIDVYARYARDDERDKSYTTAMCVLSLEIYYRYFLPLLKVH